MKHATHLGIGLLAVLVACSTSHSDGSVVGPVRGMTLAVNEAVFESAPSSDPSAFGAFIEMSSGSNLCHDPMVADADHPGKTNVNIYLFDSDGTSSRSPMGPGTYSAHEVLSSVPQGKSAWLTTTVLDSNCNVLPDETTSAQTGTVTLTAVSEGALSGLFDVTLNTNEHVTGSFEPSVCATLYAQTGSTVPVSCR